MEITVTRAMLMMLDLEELEMEVTLNDGDTILGEWVVTTEEEINGLDADETWRFVATFDDRTSTTRRDTR